jgi:cysteine desulfurase/selenocysteine lyase
MKQDFPIFKNNPKLVYLDSAASAQKPQMVLDAMNDFYTKSYANIHRGIYKLSEQSTIMFEGARATVANFLNAHSGDQIVFTKNATESINLVANSFGADLPDESTIVITEILCLG